MNEKRHVYLKHRHERQHIVRHAEVLVTPIPSIRRDATARQRTHTSGEYGDRQSSCVRASCIALNSNTILVGLVNQIPQSTTSFSVYVRHISSLSTVTSKDKNLTVGYTCVYMGITAWLGNPVTKTSLVPGLEHRTSPAWWYSSKYAKTA